MSFERPITIREAIENIDKRKYFLPAIQREFVWGTEQIERLFDSLMRDYPISSFLFWQVEEKNISKYQFYEFISDYHERNAKHNRKVNLNGSTNGITAILDGQQRLTSLYIGLKGSYANKLPRLRWDNPLAYPKKILCLNLLSYSNEEDLKYDFKFLTNEQIENDENNLWFVVGDILSFTQPVQINNYLIKNDIPSFGNEKLEIASNILFQLHDVILKTASINFYLEKDESLDKVLNVFIRVNSGGTKLTYSDLLLSIATAQWKSKDAREEINSFVDQTNEIGDGFNINKDFVLKSCLVLGGFNEIAFKIDNFTQENMLKIEEEWDDISKSIQAAVLLVSSLGYTRDTLTSNNSIIPIALYIKKIGIPENFVHSSKYSVDRKLIAKWLAIVLLKGTFGSHSDNFLRIIREVIKNSANNFPFEEINEKLKGTDKSISFNKDEIDNLFGHNYGHARVFPILASIYTSLDFNNKFHQDHIFPKHQFTVKKLEKIGIPSNKIDYFIDNYNGIANLQLLDGSGNQEKSGKDFNLWLLEKYPNEIERKAYMERHYIPNVDFNIENFEVFIEKRKILIREAFVKLIS
jgi:uncharacterized protein with ParB-like and HNH nuclease domain